MGILTTYKDYKQYENSYKIWHANELKDDTQKIAFFETQPISSDDYNFLKKKTKVVTNALLGLDFYAQTQAEDVEAVAQTAQWQALILLASGGFGIQKLLQKGLSKFTPKKSFSKFALKSLPTIAGSLAASIAYIPIANRLVTLQIDATRMARFNHMAFDWKNENNFAILSDKQIEQAKKLASQDKSPQKTPYLINTINIFSTIKNVNKLMKQKKQYQIDRFEFNKQALENKKNFLKDLSHDDIKAAKEEQEFFTQIIKQVDLKSQDRLERIEKISNVAYDSLFMGGFLENIIMNKIVNVLNITNKPLKLLAKFGLPIATIFLMSKEIASFQNNAIKAVRYKNIKKLEQNPEILLYSSENTAQNATSKKTQKPQKQNLFSFMNNVFKDMKKYRNYVKHDYYENVKFDKAVKKIELTEKQKNDAELLRKNAKMAFNNLDDKTQKYSESIEVLSEVLATPLNLLSTIGGAYLGGKISKSSKRLKSFSNLATGIGAIIGFLPIAIFELYTTHEQRQALRIACSLSAQNLNDYKHFINYDKTLIEKNDSTIGFSSYNLKNKKTFKQFEL